MNDLPVADDLLAGRIDDLLASHDRSDAPGVSIAVARRGRIVHRRSLGLAQLEQGVALRHGTPMPIGSITKQFTCAALLMLADDGILSLEDRAGRWLPELPAAQQAPTLRQLMTHTAGVRCYLDQWMFDGYRTMPVGRPWRVQCRQSAPNFEPGHGSSYSNGGYLLLTEVVARASGLPFGRFLQTRLLAPLGLSSTSMPAQRWPIVPGVAGTYMPQAIDGRPGWRPAMGMTEELFGDGGMVSTATDLVRWATLLREASGPVNLRQMTQPTVLADGSRSGYGFGLISQDWRGMRVVQHAGGLPGASSCLFMVPEHELDIAVLFNRPAAAVDMAQRIAELVLGDQLAATPPAPGAATHARLLGTFFAEDTGLLLGFSDEQGALSLSLFGDRAFPLDGRTAGDGTLPFWADVGTGEMLFRPVDGDRAAPCQAIEYSDGARWHLARRVEPTCPSPEAIASQAAGLFRSEEAAATLRFRIEDGRLVLHVLGESGNGRYAAEAVTSELVRFWPAAFPVARLARLVRHDGRVRQIVISTGRTRSLVFERS